MARRFNLVLFLLCWISWEPIFGQIDYETLARKHKGEHAITIQRTEHLIISYEGKKLVARTEVEQERMLLEDMSLGIYNTVGIYHSYFNKLEDLGAVALVPNNNGSYKKTTNYITQTTSAKSESIFYDDTKITEITFTGLKANSIIKTNYTLSHLDLHMLPNIYFKDNWKAEKLVFKVTAPKYVHLKFVIKGEQSGNILQTTEESKNTTTYTFTSVDVPALDIYKDVPGITYYIPQVIPYITDYTLPNEDTQVRFLANTNDLYKYLCHFIAGVNKNADEQLDSIVQETCRNDSLPLDKARHIYQWVQNNIHYIAFEDSLGGFVPRQARDICKRKFGDCKDMASLLTYMCRKAGIEACFTWIGTRKLPYTYTNTPLTLVANHMICTIKVNGAWIFLDATDPIIPFGTNPYSIQGKEALVAIDEQKFAVLVVPETPAPENFMSDSTYITIDGSKITGKVVLDKDGYDAWRVAYTMGFYKNEQKDEYVKSLTTRGNNKYEQLSFTTKQEPGGQKHLKITADFTIDNYLQNAGNEKYLNLNLMSYDDYEPIEYKRGRKTQFYSNYKFIRKEVVVVKIPDGYTVTNVPPDDAQKLDDIWSYSLKYIVTGNLLTLVKEYENKSLTIPVSKFSENNSMVERLKKQFKESVTFTAK